MEYLVREVVLFLCRWLIFVPVLLCFSYVLRPILMIVLVPGALLFLAVIGGAEVRGELKKLFKEML
jgi:hypothetical protein